MGLGIGLGGFVSGFQTGYGLRQQADEAAAAEDDRQRRHKREDAADAEHAQDRAYELRQRARSEKAQDAIDAIQDDAKAQFEKGVEAGTYKEADFDQFWTDYAMPRMRHQMLLNGDVAGADALGKWGESEDAKKGGRLFGSAMMKAQSGDVAGALDDAIKAGKIKGYIDHDYDISDKEEIKDTAGNVVGYRVTFTDGKGNKLEQDIALDDVPSVVANFANPEAAFASQQARAEQERTRREGLEDYEVKKGIDKKYGGGDAKARSDAITTLRKRSEDAATAGEDVTPFDSLPPDQQEQAIADEVALQQGTRTPPIPQPAMVVDGQTGAAVPGLGQVPSANAGPAPSSSAIGLAQPAPVAVINGTPDPGLPMPRETPDSARAKASAKAQAASMMTAGEDPQKIAAVLAQSGVSQAEWPPGLLQTVGTPAP